MQDELYRLFNDMEQNVEEYEEVPVTDLELQRWKKSFQKRRNREKTKYPTKVAVAACAVLVFALAAVPFHGSVYAGMNVISYNIKQLLGISRELDAYETVVGKSLSKDGYTVTLNDVILDGKDLLIAYTTTFPESVDESGGRIDTSPSVIVDGKERFAGSTGSSRMADDYNCVEFRQIHLEDLDLDRSFDFKLEFSVYDTEHDKRITSIGDFEFSADGSVLAEETKEIPLDEDYTLPDGNVVHFTRYTMNPVSHRLFFECEDFDSDYDLNIELKDNLGNEVQDYSMTIDEENSRMSFMAGGEDTISQDATELIVTLSVVPLPEGGGEITGEYEQVGEPFTIELK